MPIELKNPKKGLINIKNNDQKCFLWCHVRHINPLKEHPGRIKEVDERLASNLNYGGIEFPVEENGFDKIEVQNNISINIFGYENKLVFPIYISNKKFKDSMDLLLLSEIIGRIVYTLQILTDLCFIKRKIKIKKWFCKNCLQCLSIS